jgi:RHS repeat-associated protein
LNTKMPHYGYQGSFSEEVSEFELNYNEFELRTYDPQIGRWTTADPYDEFASPYLGMGTDPINNVDPDGGSVWGSILSFFGGGSAGAGCASTAGMSGFGYVGATTASTVATVVRYAVVGVAIGGAAFSQFSGQMMSGHMSGTTSLNSIIVIPKRIGGTPLTDASGKPICGKGCGDDFGVPDKSKCSFNTEGLEKETDEQLFKRMKDMFDFYCDGVFEDIGRRLIEKFKSNTGGVHEDLILNNHIKTRSEYKNILEFIGDKIEEQMKASSGNTAKLNIRLNSGPYFNPEKTDIIFDRTDIALATLIHGTQGTDINLYKAEVDKVKRNYKLTIQVDIWDDFGVDRCDVKGAIDKLKSRKVGYQMRYKGFIAWWILQHQRGYKPFINKMSFKYEVSGSF